MKKKLIMLFLSIFCLLAIYVGISYVKADSGWDTDYDSGSDWGSSYDSGSSWGSDSDYSWGHDYGSDRRSNSHVSYSGNKSNFIYIMIIVFLIVCVLDSVVASKRKNASPYWIPTDNAPTFSDVSKDLLDKFGIDGEQFKKMVYEKYVAIQNAWSNFEYDKLKNLLTNELYNTYMMQLDALKLKKQKNVMTDFACMDNKITNVKEENGIISVTVYLRIQMFDYVVDQENKVVRGTDKNKIDIQYIINFVKKKDIHETICPNCGAKINVIAGGVCEYCRAIVLVDPNEFVMSRKTNVGQRRI